jgi:hypothetical protein
LKPTRAKRNEIHVDSGDGLERRWTGIMKLKILAKSSSGGPYDVEFFADGETIRVFCHCEAGVHQMMCKHKLALILGDEKMLFDATQVQLHDELKKWPQFPLLQARGTRYEREVAEIETAKANLAKKEKAIKTQMSKDLSLGGYTA